MPHQFGLSEGMVGCNRIIDNFFVLEQNGGTS